MDEREAMERLAAATHAEYVLAQAERALEGCEAKLQKLRHHCEGAEQSIEDAGHALDEAEDECIRARARADEVPDELRAAVVLARPDIVAAHAETADASGGVN